MTQTTTFPFSGRWLGLFATGCLAVLFWTGCPSNTCTQDSDCAAPQVCRNGACVANTTKETPPTDGGNEKSTTSDASEATLEPPPFGDTPWTEGSLPPPDAPADNQPLPTQGTRKAGEPCNPFATALPDDRCVANHLCAPAAASNAGICLPQCDPNQSTCTPGTRCSEVVAPDLGNALGHVCAPTVAIGFACHQAQACEAGAICMTYGASHSGICRKACKQRDDCPGQWCSSRAGVRGKDVTGCTPFVDKADDPCPSQTVCGDGLNCYGSSSDIRRCLTNCSSDPKVCPSTHTCKEIRNVTGKVVYSLCFRKTSAGEPCDVTTQCEAKYRCTTLASSPRWARCLQDCSSDPKVCGQGEACTTSGSSKVCTKVAQEGQRCEGAVTCAQGLSCQPTSPTGPRHCLKPCDSASPCPSGQTCLPLNLGTAPISVCLVTCDPKASQPCAAPTTSCVENRASSPVCLPTDADWQGTLERGKACSPHAATPKEQRCKPGLRCMALPEGWRCLQPCDPQNAACPQAEACLYNATIRQHLCAATAADGKACDVANGPLCAASSRCHTQVLRAAGTCRKDNPQPQGAPCLHTVLSCSTSDLCSGDPLTPFRWRCRARCDTGGNAPCPASQVCLPTVSNQGACFAPCGANDTCSNKQERCTEIQTNKVCL